jgi:hypothetical protein
MFVGVGDLEEMQWGSFIDAIYISDRACWVMDQPLTGLIVYQLKAKSRKVKAQKHLKHLASETWSRIQDERIWVFNLSLRSQSLEASEISVPRASRNLNPDTFSRSQS